MDSRIIFYLLLLIPIGIFVYYVYRGYKGDTARSTPQEKKTISRKRFSIVYLILASIFISSGIVMKFEGDPDFFMAWIMAFFLLIRLFRPTFGWGQAILQGIIISLGSVGIGAPILSFVLASGGEKTLTRTIPVFIFGLIFLYLGFKQPKVKQGVSKEAATKVNVKPTELNQNLIEQIRKKFEGKSTHELIQIWQENNREDWSDEAFESIRQLLTDRGVTLPHQR